MQDEEVQIQVQNRVRSTLLQSTCLERFDNDMCPCCETSDFVAKMIQCSLCLHWFHYISNAELEDDQYCEKGTFPLEEMHDDIFLCEHNGCRGVDDEEKEQRLKFIVNDKNSNLRISVKHMQVETICYLMKMQSISFMKILIKAFDTFFSLNWQLICMGKLFDFREHLQLIKHVTNSNIEEKEMVGVLGVNEEQNYSDFENRNDFNNICIEEYYNLWRNSYFIELCSLWNESMSDFMELNANEIQVQFIIFKKRLHFLIKDKKYIHVCHESNAKVLKIFHNNQNWTMRNEIVRLFITTPELYSGICICLVNFF